MSALGPLSYNELIVLQALSAGCRYGFEVMAMTELSGGTVYPILRRCEVRGYVGSRKEKDAEAHADGRPARRLHTITAVGREALVISREQLMARHRVLGLLEP